LEVKLSGSIQTCLPVWEEWLPMVASMEYVSSTVLFPVISTHTCHHMHSLTLVVITRVEQLFEALVFLLWLHFNPV